MKTIGKQISRHQMKRVIKYMFILSFILLIVVLIGGCSFSDDKKEDKKHSLRENNLSFFSKEALSGEEYEKCERPKPNEKPFRVCQRTFS